MLVKIHVLYSTYTRYTIIIDSLFYGFLKNLTPIVMKNTRKSTQARLLEDLILLQFAVFLNYQGFLLVIK